MEKINYRLRSRVRRTIEHANIIDGRGHVLKLVWHPSGHSGIAVRLMQFGMDSIEFQVLHHGVRVLGKARVLLP